MSVTKRSYSGVDDQQAMSQLTHATATENMHLVDLPYRLSSWAFDHPENIALWHDVTGELVAWALLQTPFWALDYVYQPDQPALHQEILAWADVQAQQIIDSVSGRPIWFVNCFTNQPDRIADLEAMGFADQANVGENSWSKVLMARPHTPVESAALPAGFQIHPLASEAEVAAYVNLHRDVFQSNSMTVEWRKRTLQQPTYRPDLDLVVEAPNGDLAAFCVGWYNESGFDGRPAGQIEPMGVHEKYRQLGLARAILSEAVHRLQRLGAETVYVETDNYRDAAFALYEAVGFRVWKDVLVYRKDYVGEPNV